MRIVDIQLRTHEHSFYLVLGLNASVEHVLGLAVLDGTLHNYPVKVPELGKTSLFVGIVED